MGVTVTPEKNSVPRKTRLPEDPSERDQLYTRICDQAMGLWCAAKSIALNLDEQWDAFMRDALAHARRYADWRAAFQNWLTSPYRQTSASAPGNSALARAEYNRATSAQFVELITHGTTG